MGNCNFKTEHETDNVTGKTFGLNLMPCSCNKEPLPISLCHWSRRLRQSLESRKEEGKETLCHEGNEQR
jgi:hypothetical protein